MAQVQQQPTIGSMTGSGFGSGGGGNDPDRNKFTKAGYGHYIDADQFFSWMQKKAATQKQWKSSKNQSNPFNFKAAWKIINEGRVPSGVSRDFLDTAEGYRNAHPNPRFEYFGDLEFDKKGLSFESAFGQMIGDVQSTPCTGCAARGDQKRGSRPVFSQCVVVRKDPKDPNSEKAFQGKCMSCVHQHDTCSFKPRSAPATPKQKHTQSATPSPGHFQPTTPGSNPSFTPLGTQYQLQPGQAAIQTPIRQSNPIIYSRSNQLRLPATTATNPARTRQMLADAMAQLDRGVVLQGNSSTDSGSRYSPSGSLGGSPIPGPVRSGNRSVTRSDSRLSSAGWQGFSDIPANTSRPVLGHRPRLPHDSITSSLSDMSLDSGSPRRSSREQSPLIQRSSNVGNNQPTIPSFFSSRGTPGTFPGQSRLDSAAPRLPTLSPLPQNPYLARPSNPPSNPSSNPSSNPPSNSPSSLSALTRENLLRQESVTTPGRFHPYSRPSEQGSPTIRQGQSQGSTMGTEVTAGGSRRRRRRNRRNKGDKSQK